MASFMMYNQYLLSILSVRGANMIVVLQTSQYWFLGSTIIFSFFLLSLINFSHLPQLSLISTQEAFGWYGCGSSYITVVNPTTRKSGLRCKSTNSCLCISLCLNTYCFEFSFIIIKMYSISWSMQLVKDKNFFCKQLTLVLYKIRREKSPIFLACLSNYTLDWLMKTKVKVTSNTTCKTN